MTVADFSCMAAVDVFLKKKDFIFLLPFSFISYFLISKMLLCLEHMSLPCLVNYAVVFKDFSLTILLKFQFIFIIIHIRITMKFSCPDSHTSQKGETN